MSLCPTFFQLNILNNFSVWIVPSFSADEMLLDWQNICNGWHFLNKWKIYFVNDDPFTSYPSVKYRFKDNAIQPHTVIRSPPWARQQQSWPHIVRRWIMLGQDMRFCNSNIHHRTNHSDDLLGQKFYIHKQLVWNSIIYIEQNKSEVKQVQNIYIK